MTNYEIDEEKRREKMAREIATWRVREQSPQSDPREPPADFDCVEALTKAKFLISRVIMELLETRKGDAERS